VKCCLLAVEVELTEERTNSERFKKQSDILRLELDHLLQQLAVYVIIVKLSLSLFPSGRLQLYASLRSDHK